ncbi:MAG: right-handed parallel beta-helix repeat-containing protein [Bacteroidota bacterium]
MKSYLLYLILILSWIGGKTQSLDIHPLYHSAGVNVQLPTGFDTDESSHCVVEYKSSDSTNWLSAYFPDRISWKGEDAFRVSLFNLLPGEVYDIRAFITDSVPIVEQWAIPADTFSTLAEPKVLATSTVFWVSPDGSGTDYTEQHPGELASLFQTNISCGTTIYLMDGIYATGDMVLNIWSDCSPTAPIQILAAPGANPILDGGYHSPLEWNQSANDSALFFAGLPNSVSYTNLFLLNGVRLFPYSTLDPNIISGNYHLRALNFEFDGFVRDHQTIYLKTLAGTDPAQSSVVLSQRFRALTINGMGHDTYLTLKGITFQYYGKSSVSTNGAFTAIALLLRGTNHVLIDSCSFSYNDESLVIQGGPSKLTIQNCTFTDNTGLWKHAMFKKSEANSTILYPTSLGRGLENSGIQYGDGTNGSQNIVIRNNNIDGLTNGIGFATWNSGIENIDIYGNIVRNCFDGLEVDGLFSHAKVWDNDVSHILAGISLAPPRIGPVYVYRNVFHHIISRENESDDPHFVRCAPPQAYMSAGVGIKTNPGSLFDDAASLHFINNTFHSADSIGFMMYSWDDEWKHASFLNNCFYGKNNDLFFFTALIGPNSIPDSSFQLSSIHDNYAVSPPHRIAIAKETHGQYACHAIPGVDSLATILSTLTQSPYIQIKDPHTDLPEFLDADQGDFRLGASSPLIDAGMRVDGFYDFRGLAPDIGAKESDVAIVDGLEGENLIEKRVSVYPNPSPGNINIQADSRIRSVLIYSSQGQLLDRMEGKNQLSLSMDTSLPSGIYVLRIQTVSYIQPAKLIIVEE